MPAPRALPTVCAFVVALTGLATVATSAAQGKPSVAAGYTISELAAAPHGAGACDDMAFLDGKLYVGCQNATFSGGGGGRSTLVEFGLDGSVRRTWPIKDKIDGLGADPLHHRLIATLNEDSHSHLATVTPSAPAARQITYFVYSPDLNGPTTPAALKTSGGTDNVSVDRAGNVLLTASHSKTPAGTAVLRATLVAPASPGATGTVKLAPTFADDATATKAPGGGSTALKLTDVDSGAIVPASSPRFAGSYVIDDQTALELVFARDVFSGAGLTVLKTAYGLDDIRWATAPHGTLYIVDQGAGTPGRSALYKVTGPFTRNMVMASNDSIGDQVVTVNLANGALKPFVRGLNTTKGLVYLDPSGTEPALALNGAPTLVAAGAKVAGLSPVKAAASDSSNPGLIAAIVAAVVVLLGAAAFFMRRRAA